MKWVLKSSRILGLVGASSLVMSCQSSVRPSEASVPLRAINRKVDLPRFMGDWYVIAHIPTFIETKAYNAVERYELDADGTIATTFSFNEGAMDGPVKIYRPRGFVHNFETNAEWRMQFVWPFKAAFLIAYLDEDYQTTVIGVPDRKYVWIMARKKELPVAEMKRLEKFLERTGHDLSKLRRVPHDKTR